MSNISVIIPILNEAQTIGTLLNHILETASNDNILEIIVVDGGSTDGSIKSVKTFASRYNKLQRIETPSDTLKAIQTKCMLSGKGRAKQMNFGAKHAHGTILYFLHADSFPPKNFDKYILEVVEKGREAGCFIMKFDIQHWWLTLAGFLTKLNWKACRGGDQSLFITKALFNKIGGYNENFTIYEDNDLIAKLYKIKQFTVIQKWLTTSARRYQINGVWKLQFHFMVIHIKKSLGASPSSLTAYYKKHIV